MESVATYAVKLQPIFCITDKRAVSVPDENDKLQQKIIYATQFPSLCLIYKVVSYPTTLTVYNNAPQMSRAVGGKNNNSE